MARVLKERDKVRDYTVVRSISEGNMALSYEARDGRTNDRVFLKQYSSPSIRLPWYEKYKAYQQELRRRIEASECRNFCYRFLDQFEEKRFFYQVFEFLDHSHSLQEVLRRGAERPDSVAWGQRLLMAKVLMAGIAALHDKSVVHSDLKPDNVMMIQDAEIKMGYRMRIIDMDFSILADVPPPWHGHVGYFGTAGYMSPEHKRQEVPQPASDVFTCGLMLHELLGDGHPFSDRDEDGYWDAVMGGKAAPPRLRGLMLSPARDDEVVDCIHRCLSPTPSARPTARQVNQRLNGLRTDTPPGMESRPRPEPERPPQPEPERPHRLEPPASHRALVLRGPTGVVKTFNIGIPIGRNLLRHFDRHGGGYSEERQFELQREVDEWFLVPLPGTRNATFLNGKVVESRSPLKAADTIAIGNATTGDVVLSLTVDFD